MRFPWDAFKFAAPQLTRDPLFITHFVHISGRVTLKFAQAFERAEVESLCMVVVAGGCIGDIDFHLADWIDGHGSSSERMDSGETTKDCRERKHSAFSRQHSAKN